MKTIRNWNAGWHFSKCPDAVPDPAVRADGAGVTLPHTWYADGDYYRGDAMYQKRFSLPLKTGEKAFVRFHGVDKSCQVYLNGQHIGSHGGGYTAFALELTSALSSGENLLSVTVNNETGETVSPLSGDFAMFGGIHRDVELIVTPAAHFDLLYHGTQGVLFRTGVDGDGRGTLNAEARLCGDIPAGAVVRFTLTDASGAASTQCEVPAAASVSACIAIDVPHLWQGCEDPYLYTAAAALCSGNQVLDVVALPVGFRSISVDPEKGFFLNGKHLKLRGVAKHQDTARVFSAAGPAQWQQDMDLIEEMGANAVRLSHYPHPWPVYNICDQKGLVVWAEIPLLKLTMNDGLLENAGQQLTEMILQNLHHPSICFWGIQNEVAIFGDKPFMAERLRILNDLTHQLDGSRYSASANLNGVGVDSALNRITDVTAHNVYYGWYYGEMPDHADFLDAFHAANPSMPLGISEYGVDCSPALHSETPQVNDYSEEFQALYHETVYPYMADRDFVWGSFVWNMFDFVSASRNAGGVKARNIKGLVTHDRSIRKDSFYYYKAIWSEVPFVQIAQKRFASRAAGSMTVKVYSNQPEVTLTVSGQSRTAPVINGSAVFPDVPLAMGGNKVSAAAGACTDTAVFVRVAEPEQSYIYVDNEPGLNVRNWFVDEAEEARLFPEDAYSLRDTILTLTANAEVMAVVEKLLPQVAKMMREGPGIFTLEELIHHEKPDCSEEEVKALNLALIKILK